MIKSSSCESNGKFKILFVCYGNTCRSPMAEAVFLNLAKKKNLESRFVIDSPGISKIRVYDQVSNFKVIFTGDWQAGEEPNQFVKMILSRCKTPIFHKARQITANDFKNFDYLVGMDFYNITELARISNALETENKIILLGNYNSNKDEKIIHDPFLENKIEDFEKCYEQIFSSCANLLVEICDHS